jgi:hypothetical protein
MSYLDTIAHKDPLELTKDDISGLIAYYRKLRANLSSGAPKPKKEKADLPIDLVALGLKPTPEPLKRRF